MEMRRGRDAGNQAPGTAASGRLVPVTGAKPYTAYEDDVSSVARLLVAGVGGAGVNALNHMIDVGIRGVEFLAMNTDAQALQQAHASLRLRLGERVTRGLGAGGNPYIGRCAAEESFDSIRAALSGADMVFITAGMGGGTGTGASPLVARAAREEGALSVAVVTTPFAFERRRMSVAQEGLDALRDTVDALIVVPNTRLMKFAAQDLTAFEAYRLADEVLRQGIQGISDLITVPGLINLDFADIRSIMADAGSAHMSVGTASGENRAMLAARNAATNPLLNVDISGARGIVFNITGGDDLTMSEVNEIADLIMSAAHPNANITFGTVYEPAMKGVVKVTIVATGFEARVVQSHPTPAPSNMTLAAGLQRARERGDAVRSQSSEHTARSLALYAPEPTPYQTEPVPVVRLPTNRYTVDERAPRSLPAPRQPDAQPYSASEAGVPPQIYPSNPPRPRSKTTPPTRTDQRARSQRHHGSRRTQPGTARNTLPPGYYGEAFLVNDDPGQPEPPASRSMFRRFFNGR